MNAAALARGLTALKLRDEALELLRGLEPLAIKGSVFAASLYRLDERLMEDVDLLVPAGRLAEARARLEAAGFRSDPGQPTNLRRGGEALDLEDSIWYLRPEAYQALWTRAIVVDGAPTLSWEDHFVFVIAHSAAHHGWWDDQHAEDLRRLLAWDMDWEAVVARLKQARLTAAADASFRLLELTPPSPLKLSRAERLESRAYQALLKRGQLPAIGHYLRWWSSADRLAFLGRMLSPDDEFLKRRYATEQPRIYRALRPALLAASIARSAAQTLRLSLLGR